MRRHRVRTQLVFAVPIIYAVYHAFRQLRLVRGAPLDPDAENYLLLADAFSWSVLLGGSAREPAWIAILAMPVKVLGPHPMTIRILGIFGFLALVAAFQFILTRLHGPLWGMVGGLTLAASPWLIFQAPRGLREEAAAAGLLLVGAAASAWRVHHRVTLVVGLFAGAAFLALLRWDTVLVTLPTLVLVALVRRMSWKRWGLGLTVFFLIIAPLLVGNFARYGDPLFHSNIHAVFFRNLEFAGQAGLPTAEEREVDAYGGPHETWFGYLFDYHSVGEVARRTVRGTGLILAGSPALGFFFPEPPQVDLHLPTLRSLRSPQSAVPWLIAGAALYGAVLAFRSGRNGPWPIAVMWVGTLVPLAPIAHIFDWRLALPALVFTMLLALHAAASWHRPRPDGRRDRPEVFPSSAGVS